MKNILVFLILVYSVSLIGQVKSIKKDNLKISYDQSIENYALALSEILRVSISESKKIGFKLPKKIELSIQNTDRVTIYNNGSSKITYEYDSVFRFAPPRCAYSICRVIDNLGTLYLIKTIKIKGFKKLAWMDPGFKFYWSGYFASTMIDKVYDITTDKVWPIPYNFKKHGTENRIILSQDEKSPLYNTVNAWSDLGKNIGFAKFPDFFTFFRKNGCTEQAFIKAINKFMDKESAKKWVEKYGKVIIKS